MKRTVLLCCAALAFTAFSQAQDSAQRPAELRKLEKIVGNWEGEGKFYMAPDAEGIPWTSKSTARWILNGHFLVDDMQVKFADSAGMPSDTLVFRTLHGWDSDRNEVFKHEIGNNGVSVRGAVHWLDDDTLISVSNGIEMGTPYVERSVSNLGEGTFQMMRASGDGPMYVYVEGKVKRSDKEFSATSEEANVAFMPPAQETALLQRWEGSYAMSGKATLPGSEPGPLSAGLKIQTIFGGQASLVHVLPGGGRPELFGHMYWDAENACYGYFKATAEGRYVSYKAHPVGADRLVFTAAYTTDGAPAMERIDLGLSKDGGLASIAVDLMQGATPIARIMEGRYTREASTRTIEAKFTEGSCCARAAAAGNTCKHPCCVTAAAEGKVCTQCNS